MTLEKKQNIFFKVYPKCPGYANDSACHTETAMGNYTHHLEVLEHIYKGGTFLGFMVCSA